MSVKVIFREDRNRYQVTYWLGGKRHRPLFVEKQEADNFARRIRLGLSPESTDSITIDEAGKKYFESYSKKKNPKSKSNDKRYINLHFHFMTYERGLERLSSVTLEDMEAFRDWLPIQTEYDDRPMSMGPSTVNRCLRVLKHFYKKCIQWKHLKETPCFYLEFLDAEENERRAMTGGQCLKALAKAEDWFKPVMQFMYLTGSPASSVARLTVDDIDFAQRQYFLIRKKGRKAKTKRIPMAMTDQVFALLVMVRNQWPSAIGVVFRDRQGRPLLADRITRLGNDAVKAAKLKGVSLYSMRHALATDLTEANVATEIVRQVMGHQSITTTQRYANKVGLKSIAGAIDSVRGGSLVAKSKNTLRQKNGGF